MSKIKILISLPF